MHTNRREFQKPKLPTITVKFQGGKTVVFKNTTLIDIAKRLLNQATFVNLNPMLVIFNTGKQLYFNKSEWNEFLNNTLSIQELFENCETEGLWRNTETVNFENKLDLDPKALWRKKGNQLILVDDDWNIIVNFKDHKFTEF